MTAISMDGHSIKQSGTNLATLQGPVYQATTLYQGQMVAAFTANGYLTDPTYGTTGAVLGVSQATINNASGSSGDVNANLLCGEFAFPNHGSHTVTAAYLGKVVYASDNATISTTSTDGPVAGVHVGFTTDATPEVVVFIHPVVNYLLSQATLTSDLADTTAGKGASLVAFTDSGSKTTAATVDAALDEVYAYLLSPKAIRFSLHDFREVDSNGDVGNIAANGGLLASDTTPILRADAAESEEISWAASNSDSVQVQTSLPSDFDDTQDCTLQIWAYSGTTDAADFVIETSWDGGAKVSDAASDTATKSATVHKLEVTIANGDIPAGASYVTIDITPPAHTTNAIAICAMRLLYTPKLA